MELQKAMQDMIDANQAKMKAEMKADHEEMMARMKAKMDGRQEEMKAQMASLVSRIEDSNEKFKVFRDALVSWMDVHQERMMAFLGKTEATDLEANLEEIESETEHEKVPKEDAAVKPVRGLRK
jgi:hypothetical protein